MSTPPNNLAKKLLSLKKKIVKPDDPQKFDRHADALDDSTRTTEKRANDEYAKGDIKGYNRLADKRNRQMDRYAILRAQGDSAKSVNELKRLRGAKSASAAVGGEMTPMEHEKEKPKKLERYVPDPKLKIDESRFTPIKKMELKKKSSSLSDAMKSITKGGITPLGSAAKDSLQKNGIGSAVKTVARGLRNEFAGSFGKDTVKMNKQDALKDKYAADDEREMEHRKEMKLKRMSQAITRGTSAANKNSFKKQGN